MQGQAQKQTIIYSGLKPSLLTMLININIDDNDMQREVRYILCAVHTYIKLY